jgi:hypothetical protein
VTRRRRDLSKPIVGTSEVACETLCLSRADALDRVQGGIKQLWRKRCSHAELRFKPHWEVEATVSLRLFAHEQQVQVNAIVDGLTGIARCRRPGQTPELELRAVEPERRVVPAIDRAAALEAARKVIGRMARRRRGVLDRLETPVLFYKPVWLVAETIGGSPRYVVDGHTGLLARALP